MHQSNNKYRIVISLTVTLWASAAVVAQPNPQCAAEEKAIAHCLGMIRACQLPNGAISMTIPASSDASIWVAPYFAHHAALALLASNPDPKVADLDLKRVGRWLEWCCKHQETGGFWYDYEGTLRNLKSNGKVDAHDSSAALFLLVAERYQRGGGKVTGDLKKAVDAAIKCITSLTDNDGLTWAKSDYKVKFLMDNVEVYGGLSAAHKFLAAIDKQASQKAAEAAAKLGKGLVKYWAAKDTGRFAWALHPSGQYDGGLDKMYPHGLAQLFGVAFVAKEAGSLREVSKKFTVENTVMAPGSERFLIAATRSGEKNEQAMWRKMTVTVASGFNSDVYVFRPGLVVLALREGADWMPSLLNPQFK